MIITLMINIITIQHEPLLLSDVKHRQCHLVEKRVHSRSEAPVQDVDLNLDCLMFGEFGVTCFNIFDIFWRRIDFI